MMTDPRKDSSDDGDVVKAGRRRNYGQWLCAAVILFYAAGLIYSLSQNPNIDYPLIGGYLTNQAILDGLVTTLKLTLISGAVGWIVGILVAVCRLSSNKVLSTLSLLFIWLFRGSPLLVQILIWGNLALLFQTISFGIPFTGISFFEADTNLIVTPLVAAILGLGLNEAAYMAEIVRAGIISVGKGQGEAAKALGMSRALTMRRIVLPQALRIIIPPTANQMINLLKASSLVSVIAGGDLLTNAQIISASNLKTVELLLVATFWYLAVISVASVGQYFLERRYERGYR
ncbi:amino acid ABC transporter permease [Arthrobacter sp. StoSoilB22]|uniref:amino acid ABC transporter permease n=1 Tax=Arthrobacter sp. StoSoilB22 TaxID=2830996 RepID=UPI001CC39442|nr:amino acid ABC transporter permease [Arthrobacter sp. StoSoilB22]